MNWLCVWSGGVLGLVVLLSMAVKRRAYVDPSGAVIPYVVMPQMMDGDENNFDAGDGDFDWRFGPIHGALSSAGKTQNTLFRFHPTAG